MQIIYQMRERLEPLALGLSVERLDHDQQRQMSVIQDEIEETGDDIIRFLDLDRRFHLLSYTGCPSAELLGSVTRLWNSTQHYRRALMLMGGRERLWLVNAEHRLLIDAIARRDVPDCERYLTGHIRRTRIELEKHPELFARSERAAGS
jgi:DNA-binding GntR family transcriptional regulator